ncbi:MAG: hypothetical protein LBR59_01475 [Endomicrobium sp.]|jgi:apolipoprotein N-acyltransferase|nr:hypothetical protein [Endomicrobium sp.]
MFLELLKVENLFLVSANTGISGIIESSGIFIDKTNVLKKHCLMGFF